MGNFGAVSHINVQCLKSCTEWPKPAMLPPRLMSGLSSSRRIGIQWSKAEYVHLFRNSCVKNAPKIAYGEMRQCTQNIKWKMGIAHKAPRMSELRVRRRRDIVDLVIGLECFPG